MTLKFMAGSHPPHHPVPVALIRLGVMGMGWWGFGTPNLSHLLLVWSVGQNQIHAYGMAKDRLVGN